ncbi:hypothetical protein HUN58_02345 [Curtobacterium sp. Csp1]|uniref:HIRAN domain-containing protein n=1 Tax=unclassified Curtobacterium TaxID=257496 RepID=UPI00159880B3|nr:MULTISPECIES: HIRAN domain-containing protein [unclassified Curtobacterium]QKS12732.1 hypothetical protein HUN60_05960 [Curtobacterium sp. csp3]QKS18898.1 hypothetical protein HUN58_02345 [Curtobacterium sp. Csp1]
MVLEIVLVMIVLVLGVRLLVRHFTRADEGRPESQRLDPTSTEKPSTPNNADQTSDLDRAKNVTPGLEASTAVGRRNRSGVIAVRLDKQLQQIDMRALPSSRYRIVGSAYWVTDSERTRYGGTEYALVREPANEHDENAVAVYGRGRKVGHLSAAKAAALAAELDRLGPAAFIVSGDTVSERSIRLWVDIPRVAAVRAFRAS